MGYFDWFHFCPNSCHFRFYIQWHSLNCSCITEWVDIANTSRQNEANCLHFITCLSYTLKTLPIPLLQTIQQMFFLMGFNLCVIQMVNFRINNELCRNICRGYIILNEIKTEKKWMESILRLLFSHLSIIKFELTLCADIRLILYWRYIYIFWIWVCRQNSLYTYIHTNAFSIWLKTHCQVGHNLRSTWYFCTHQSTCNDEISFSLAICVVQWLAFFWNGHIKSRKSWIQSTYSFQY